MRALTLAVMVPLFAAPLPAQDTASAGPRPRRLSIAVQVGATIANTGSALADELRQAGYDDYSDQVCIFTCIGPTPHPVKRSPAASVSITASYAVHTRLTIGVGRSNVELGGATGYRRDSSAVLGGDYAICEWETTANWASVLWTPHTQVRLGGGPSRYRFDGPSGSHSRWGILGEAGLMPYPGARVFVDVVARIHVIPSEAVHVGPGDALTLHPRWTHGSLQLGMGVRL